MYSGPDRPKPRILLVEDDPAVRRSLQLFLQSQGFDVRAYRSAVGLSQDPEAVKAVCLVADLVMPDKDAVELLDELRAAGWNAPAILISGCLSEASEARARAAGFARILAKPLPYSLLTRTIAEVVASRQNA